MTHVLLDDVERWSTAASGLDWNGSFGTLTECDKLVENLIRSNLLRQLLAHLPTNPDLVKQCEQLQGIKKLVLIDDIERDIRLRLHIFENYAFDVAHNHKWSFHSTVLKGSYCHSLHGEVGENNTSEDIERMPVVNAINCRVGDSYFLRHNMVHSLRAESETMTLVIRGPVFRGYSLWADFKSTNKWTHIGDETDHLKRALNLEEVKDAVHFVDENLEEIENEWGRL